MLTYTWHQDYQSATITWRGRDIATLQRVFHRWYLIADAGYRGFVSEGAAREMLSRTVARVQ
jgi:hypothetical protein